MIIQKAIYLNSVDPAALNFRAPMGMETKLDVTFYNQNGSPYNQDLAAQLQLTSRTGEQTTYHAMPSTDVVNGKARAVIPADFLNDGNGYRLRITGTVQSEPCLLALGTLYPLAGAGPEAVPQDTIDTVDLSLERNEDVHLNVKLWGDTGKGFPLDLASAGVTVVANIYTAKGGVMLVPFTTAVMASNELELSLTTEQVNTLPDRCWWSMGALQAAGLTTLCEGDVTVAGTVIPPLTEITVNYDYQKPATTGSPANGQIVHATYTQGTLQVAKVDADLNDFSATLALVGPGDQIAVGVTTWTVGGSVDRVGWIDFSVQPIQQAAPTGVTPVTFKRP